MTQLPAQPGNTLFSAPAAGQGTQPVTQPNTMGAPVQTQLDPTSPAGPGQGGAATAQGIQAVMGQQQAENAQPGQDMAMQSGQPVAGGGGEQQPPPQMPPSPQGNPAWNPGAPNQFSQTGLLYNQGQGPITSQVPGMDVMAALKSAGVLWKGLEEPITMVAQDDLNPGTSYVGTRRTQEPRSIPRMLGSTPTSNYQLALQAAESILAQNPEHAQKTPEEQARHLQLLLNDVLQRTWPKRYQPVQGRFNLLEMYDGDEQASPEAPDASEQGYKAPEPIGSVKGAETLRGDLELLATGTSARFRERVRGKSGSVEHVDLAIAPQAGEARVVGDTNVSKIGHSGRKSASAGPVHPLLGKGLAAARNFIHVIEKNAQELRPEDTHRLNHETEGPMKLSAVGESGLVMGVRPWNVQGEDAWPESRPIGRSPARMGQSKMAAGLLSDMGANAGRVGISPILGVGGAIGGLGSGAVGGLMSGWNQTVGRLGAPKVPQVDVDTAYGTASRAFDYAGRNAADFGKSVGLTGLNNTRSQPGKPIVSTANQKLQEIQHEPGVTPGVRRVSEIGKNVADTSGTLATLAGGGGGLVRGGKGLSRFAGPTSGLGLKAPGAAKAINTGANVVSKGMRAAGGKARQSARVGAKGMGIGATIDAGSETVPKAPGQQDINLTKPLAALGAASPVLGGIPGKLGKGLAVATHPLVAGPTLAHEQVLRKKVSPVLDEGVYQGMGDRITEQSARVIEDNPGLRQAIENAGLTPEEASQKFMAGTLDVNAIMQGAGGDMSPEQLQTLGAGMDPGKAFDMAGVTPAAQQQLAEEVSKATGKPVEELVLTDYGPWMTDMIGKFQKVKEWGGDNPVIQKLMGFVEQMFKNPIQGLLVGGAILSAIVGLIGGLHGKGGVGAAGLLGALGLGAGAYMQNPDTFKGLVGMGKPGDTSQQATAADAVGAPTPDQLDQRATDAGVEGIPGVEPPPQKSPQQGGLPPLPLQPQQ